MLDQIFNDIMNADRERQAPATTVVSTEPPQFDDYVPEVDLGEVKTDDPVYNDVASTPTAETTNPPASIPMNDSTYQSTYEYPMTSYKGIVSGKDPGLTKQSTTKHGALYDVNLSFMNSLEKEIANNDYEFIYGVFDKLAKKPIINGKEVELSTLRTNMQSPAGRKALMDQALELEADPNLDSETRFALIQNHHLSIMKNGELLHSRKLWKDQLQQCALKADEIRGAQDKLNKGVHYNYHQKLFGPDGNMLSEKAYNTLLMKEAQDELAEWEKNNPFPKNAPVYWQRTDQPNPMGQRASFNPITKKWEQLDPRPKMQNSQEGWYTTRNNIQQGILNKIKNFSYKDMRSDVIEQYNLSDSPATKLRTEFEGKFSKNKGGEIHGTIGTIDFDAANKTVQLSSGDVIHTPEMVEYGNILNLISNNENDILVQPGGIAGNLPDKDEASVSKVSNEMKSFLKTITEDYGALDDSKKSRATTKLPRGGITFASVAGGGNDYYAYNIKFHSDYIDNSRFKGTETENKIAHAKQHPEIITDGFTVYIPKKLALGKDDSGEVMSRLARDNERATTVSPVEGLFTVDNNIKLHVPNAGQLNLTRDETTGDTKVSGFTVSLNPNSGIMDTIHLPVQTVPIDKATDLDWIVDDFYQKSYNQLYNNDAIMNALIQIKGVRDPKILQANLNNQ
jgi:hypothetical protein